MFNIFLYFNFFCPSLIYALALYVTGQEQPDIEGSWSTNEGTRSTHERPRPTDKDQGLPMRDRGVPLGTAVYPQGPCSTLRDRGLPLITGPTDEGLYLSSFSTA